MANCYNERLIENHCASVSKLYNKIQECHDISILNTMYSYLKECASGFYSNGNIHWLYDTCIMNLMDSERLFNEEYLLDNKFYLDVNNPLSIK